VNAYLFLFAQGFALNGLACLVPGPDMLLVLRSSTARGRLAGLLCALGIVGGLVIYSSAALVVASAISAAPPLLFDVVQVAGACYLAYLGFGLLRSHGTVDQPHEGQPEGRNFLVQGFVTNVTNPKCLLFYLAVLTQFEAARHALGLRAALMTGLVVGPLCSFVGLACLGGLVHSRLTSRGIRRIDRTSGVLLLGFAVLALALSGARWFAVSV
jgi:threonine/homoserine/homoserine lactone efflux protein